jgi:hypothetical protein
VAHFIFLFTGWFVFVWFFGECVWSVQGLKDDRRQQQHTQNEERKEKKKKEKKKKKKKDDALASMKNQGKRAPPKPTTDIAIETQVRLPTQNPNPHNSHRV